MNLLVVGALLGVALPGGGDAVASEPVCPAREETEVSMPRPELVRELLLWVGANTEYEVAGALRDPPEIAFCRAGETIDYEGRQVIVDPRLRAAYDLDAQRIELVEPWRADDPRHVGTLLHELIHHLQLLDREWTCMGDAEWQAYKLQERWLQEQGVESAFDWLYIFTISRCEPDIHP